MAGFLKWTRQGPITALVLGTAVALAACSSSSGATTKGGQSSSDLAPYTAVVRKAENAITTTAFSGPATPIKAPRNIKLAIIAESTSLGGPLIGAQDITKAARLLGWHVQTFNGNSDPITENQLLQQAANTGFQAIILDAVDPSQVRAGLTAAHNKHIPVGSYTAGVAPSPDGIAFDVGADWTTAGKAIGAWIVASEHGRANLLDFEDKEFASQVDLVNSVNAEVSTCSGCSVQTQQFVASDVGPDLGVRVVNMLQKDPHINIVDMGYDPAADVVVPAIRQATIASSVSLVGANGEPQNINWIRAGQVQTMDLVFSWDYGAFAAVDQMSRLLLGQPLIKDPNAPLRYAYGEGCPWGLVTTGNIKSISTPANGQDVPFAVDKTLPRVYGKLWGLGS
jgi:ribose transport system substrate-binding protein